MIGAYIQIAAKEFLDFLSDNYLNTPIFIIIIGKNRLIFIIIKGEKTNLFSNFKNVISKASCFLDTFWDLHNFVTLASRRIIIN